MITEQDIQQFSKQCERIFTQIRRDVIGQQEVVEGTVIAMIAGGNVLLEGVPGVGKTRLVRTLGRVFDLPFSRIQFTPDLMPADVTGTNIIVKDDSGNSTFSFQPGPIFSNIILADEINRATPKTQSALLEAMQEHTVTVMGVSRKMPEPFFVLATQNPRRAGRYLSSARSADGSLHVQTRRAKPQSGRADDDCRHDAADDGRSCRTCLHGEELLAMRATANQIPVAQDVMRYAMTLCSATHPDSECASEAAKKYVRLGASPRAGQSLISAAKVKALMKGRFNVSFSDLNELAYPVLRHRMKMNFEAIAERVSPDEVVSMIISEVGKSFGLGKDTAPLPVQEKKKRFGKK